jgi:predicted ABC-type transport system involved in lysophospholipase L1 biosynthesis ATPase subunit
LRAYDLAVLENVALPPLLDGHDSAAAYTLAAEWLDRAGLADHDTTSARICGSCCSARRATAARQSSSSRRAGAANVRRIVSEKTPQRVADGRRRLHHDRRGSG